MGVTYWLWNEDQRTALCCDKMDWLKPLLATSPRTANVVDLDALRALPVDRALTKAVVVAWVEALGAVPVLVASDVHFADVHFAGFPWEHLDNGVWRNNPDWTLYDVDDLIAQAVPNVVGNVVLEVAELVAGQEAVFTATAEAARGRGDRAAEHRYSGAAMAMRELAAELLRRWPGSR